MALIIEGGLDLPLPRMIPVRQNSLTHASPTYRARSNGSSGATGR